MVCHVGEISIAAALVESVVEWEVKGAEDPAMGVWETETGWDQEAEGQDRGPAPVDDNTAT